MTGTQIAGIVIGIIGFLFLITIHEGGHCLVSKALGVRVNEFSVGMGPLIGQKEKNGTMYSLRLIPIGGYCALEGEFGEDMTDEEIAGPHEAILKALQEKFNAKLREM